MGGTGAAGFEYELEEEEEEGKPGKDDDGGRDGEARGRGEGDACCDGGRGSPPSKIPLMPMLRGGNDFGVGAFESKASAEKGDALGGVAATGGLVVRSTVRSEGCCW